MSKTEQDPDLFLVNYPREYLPCRADRHQWTRRPRWHFDNDRRNVVREFICEDCGGRKFEPVDSETHLRVGKLRYRPAKGYRSPPRSGITTDQYRALHLANDFNEALKDGRVY